MPYLRVANVQDGFLDLAEMKTIAIRRYEKAKYALAIGDLVMTEGGDIDKPGRAAIWRGELDHCAHQNHVYRVRPNRDLVLTDYLRDLAGSEYGKAYFLSVAKRTTGIASMNKTQLGGLPVPLPPLDLQTRYACLANRVRSTVSRSEVARVRATTLASSLMTALLAPPPKLRARSRVNHAAFRSRPSGTSRQPGVRLAAGPTNGTFTPRAYHSILFDFRVRHS